MPYPPHTQKVIAKVWTMPSSHGAHTYETLQFTDGSASCNCPGYCRRVTADGQRSCKHTRMVDMGTADAISITRHFYDSVKPQQDQQRKDTNGQDKDGTPTVGKLGQRKLIL